MITGIFFILGAMPPRRTVKAEIVDYGTDKDAYRVGDRATVRLSIKNTGDSDITSVEVHAGIEKEFLGSFVKLLSDRIMLPVGAIKPGETKQYTQTSTIPNFPGRYRVSARVIVNGQEAGEFRKVIGVAR